MKAPKVATVERGGVRYEATREGSEVTVTADGSFAGRGRWSRRGIVDCPAVLGGSQAEADAIYVELDRGLRRAGRCEGAIHCAACASPANWAKALCCACGAPAKWPHALLLRGLERPLCAACGDHEEPEDLAREVLQREGAKRALELAALDTFVHAVERLLASDTRLARAKVAAASAALRSLLGEELGGLL